MITQITGNKGSSGAISAQVFDKLIYGYNSPLGRSVLGTEESVSGLSLDDVKSRHAQLLNSKARIHIAGDIGQDKVKAFDKVAQLFSAEVSPEIDLQVTPKSKSRVYFIDVPGSKQSILRIGKLVPSTGDADFNKIDYTNEKLGGGISGNLSQTLRIEKGYTYGAFSGVTRGNSEQVFRVTTSVRANATKASLDIIHDMLTNYGNVYSDDDAEITRQKLLKDNTRAFESLGNKRSILRNISEFGKDPNYIEKEQQELLNMTTADFQNIAKKYLKEDEMTYLIVGDKETQFSEVQAFANEKTKGEVTWLDIDGTAIVSKKNESDK